MTHRPQGKRQTTVARRIAVSGIGFHLAQPCRLAICPAPADTGIVFERTDFYRFRIPALARYVGHVAYSTALLKDGVMVCTVEHLLSALYGCHIDNAVIELDAAEVPILDGSARALVELIKEAGTVELPEPRKYLRVLKPVEVVSGERRIRLTPAPALTVDCTIEFDHPLIGRQQTCFTFENGEYPKHIASARTFIFQDEFCWRREVGQVRGGSPDTAVVLTGDGLLNGDGLRFEDEFVRHKTLDVLGDFALLGRPLLGQIEAVRSGHGLNNELVNKLLSEPDAWDVVSAAP
jgi:UDP-3-O-[3-hydroxymyristoyl] N-acetylglucosamine deacetylase